MQEKPEVDPYNCVGEDGVHTAPIEQDEQRSHQATGQQIAIEQRAAIKEGDDCDGDDVVDDDRSSQKHSQFDGDAAAEQHNQGDCEGCIGPDRDAPSVPQFRGGNGGIQCSRQRNASQRGNDDTRTFEAKFESKVDFLIVFFDEKRPALFSV